MKQRNETRTLPGAQSLVDVLRAHAQSRPDFAVLTFLADGKSAAEQTLTFAALDTQARAIAATLQARGLAGQPVMLLHPPGLEFVAALFGCFYAGAVAVPSHAPVAADPSRSIDRLGAIVQDAGARCALTSSVALPSARAATQGHNNLKDLHFLASDDITASDGAAWNGASPSGAQLALIQYTSGSTSDPKGVLLSHANLLYNLATIADCYGTDTHSVGVIWLPPYHDMGLIGGILQPVWRGFRCVLMSPLAFMHNPLRWLEAISHYRASVSGAPNFAYESCLRAYKRRPCELDLGSWQVAFNAAEPIRERTLREFTHIFAGAGLRADAFVTNYGLAEATLLVTSSMRGAAPPVLTVGTEALEAGRVELAPSGRSQTLVSSGAAARGSTLRVVHPELGTAVADAEVGEIWVAGPGVAAGYHAQPAASGATFAAHLPGTDGAFLRTGDLGFLQGGELYVTGRLKDLIVIRARNVHPQDLERTAETAHAHARAGGCAAFAIDDAAGSEAVVIVQEVNRVAAQSAEQVASALRHALLVEHQISPLEVVLVPRRSVLKTPSGKVRRQATKALWLNGQLDVLFVSRRAAPIADAAAVNPETMADTMPGAMLVSLRRVVAAALDGAIPADQIRAGQRLSDLGLDSLAMVNLKVSLETLLGVELPTAFLRDDPTLQTLLERIAELRGERPAAPAAARRPQSAPPLSATAPAPSLRAAANGLRHTPADAARNSPAFSLMFFSSYGGQADGTDKYALVQEAARFADAAGFEAIWLPERHFHPFGGLFPNPAVVASALSRSTERIRLRAGSVVLPLHDPIRVAEDWSVVDNLSGGRVDLSFATGWDAQSFVLAPDRYAQRHVGLTVQVDEFKRLWRGEPLQRKNGAGDSVSVQIFPKPRQAEPGVWLTAAQDVRTFEQAGAAGHNLLTALLFQTPEALGEKIKRYRQARAGAGLDPRGGHVTLMLHTFIGHELDAVREQVKAPFTRYLESSVDLWRSESQALGTLDAARRAAVLELAFERYFRSAGLMGTVETAARTVAGLRDIGVDEIACLIDFGVPDDQVLAHLPQLDALRRRFAGRADAAESRPAPPARERVAAATSGSALNGINLDARHALASCQTQDVFDRAEHFDLPDQLRNADLMPFYLEFTDMTASHAKVGGRPVVMMGGLDYLGLSADARVREAAAHAALTAGTSRTGSRLHCGSTPEQGRFEALLASFLGREDALVFASGYMAQTGLITALMDPDTQLLLDDRAHASIVDGGLIAKCRIRRFAHNDPASLERVLRQDAGRATLVMIESLYSNEGDLAPLPQIREICSRHGARLAVDEAHGLGVLGATGRGIEDHFRMPGSVDVLSGTFSKSLASVGGWVAGSRKVIDWVRFQGRSILFSAAISPAALAAAHRSLEILMDEPQRVAQLRANARRWRDLLVAAGLPLVKEPAGPLVSVRIGDERTCLLFSRRLLDAGVYANTVLHPSVPRGDAVLRTVVSAAHREHELRFAAEAFGRIHRELSAGADSGVSVGARSTEHAVAAGD